MPKFLQAKDSKSSKKVSFKHAQQRVPGVPVAPPPPPALAGMSAETYEYSRLPLDLQFLRTDHMHALTARRSAESVHVANAAQAQEVYETQVSGPRRIRDEQIALTARPYQEACSQESQLAIRSSSFHLGMAEQFAKYMHDNGINSSDSEGLIFIDAIRAHGGFSCPNDFAFRYLKSNSKDKYPEHVQKIVKDFKNYHQQAKLSQQLNASVQPMIPSVSISMLKGLIISSLDNDMPKTATWLMKYYFELDRYSTTSVLVEHHLFGDNDYDDVPTRRNNIRITQDVIQILERSVSSHCAVAYSNLLYLCYSHGLLNKQMLFDLVDKSVASGNFEAISLSLYYTQLYFNDSLSTHSRRVPQMNGLQRSMYGSSVVGALAYRVVSPENDFRKDLTKLRLDVTKRHRPPVGVSEHFNKLIANMITKPRDTATLVLSCKSEGVDLVSAHKQELYNNDVRKVPSVATIEDFCDQHERKVFRDLERAGCYFI